jgi:hypothetical protein
MQSSSWEWRSMYKSVTFSGDPAHSVQGKRIHSTEPFLPEQHLRGDSVIEYRETECSCPGTAPNSPWAVWEAMTNGTQTALPAPLRISVGKQELSEVLSEAYVINLPGREDRRHYMCRFVHFPCLFTAAHRNVCFRTSHA